MPIFPDSFSFFAIFADRAVSIAEAPHDIKAFQRETNGVELVVARGARRDLCMGGELLADGGRAACIGFDRFDA